MIDITAAFADQLHSAFEARIPRFDLMLEASVACLVVRDLVAYLTVAVSVLAVTGSVITSAAVGAVVATAVPELVTN